MADGRCFTISTSSQLLNDYVMNSNGVALADNYSYRKLLQKKGTQIVDDIQALQSSGGVMPSPLPELRHTPLKSSKHILDDVSPCRLQECNIDGLVLCPPPYPTVSHMSRKGP
jgi:hypothetical protein